MRGDKRIRTLKVGVTNSAQGGAIMHAREWSLLVQDGSTRACRRNAVTHRRTEAGATVRAAAGVDGLTERVSGIGR